MSGTLPGPEALGLGPGHRLALESMSIRFIGPAWHQLIGLEWLTSLLTGLGGAFLARAGWLSVATVASGIVSASTPRSILFLFRMS